MVAPYFTLLLLYHIRRDSFEHIHELHFVRPYLSSWDIDADISRILFAKIPWILIIQCVELKYDGDTARENRVEDRFSCWIISWRTQAEHASLVPLTGRIVE